MGCREDDHVVCEIGTDVNAHLDVCTRTCVIWVMTVFIEVLAARGRVSEARWVHDEHRRDSFVSFIDNSICSFIGHPR